MSKSKSMTTADKLRAYAGWLRSGQPEMLDADELEQAADEMEAARSDALADAAIIAGRTMGHGDLRDDDATRYYNRGRKSAADEIRAIL